MQLNSVLTNITFINWNAYSLDIYALTVKYEDLLFGLKSGLFDIGLCRLKKKTNIKLVSNLRNDATYTSFRLIFLDPLFKIAMF
jgi:hypothetical protein